MSPEPSAASVAPTADSDSAATEVRPEDERLSPGKTIGYGVQHILAMFGGVIAV